jgi:hypothetical protein
VLEGSVLLLCCNLIADGEVGGDIVLISSNLQLGPHAVVHGDVALLSGNFDRAPGATITGSVRSKLPAWVLLRLIGNLCLIPLLAIALAGLLLRWYRRRKLAGLRVRPSQ